MDAIDLLISQHREMEALFKQVKQVLDSGDTGATKKLFAEVADKLTTHIASEEEIFYPAVRAKRTEDILLESLEEHLSLKRLLADLLQLQPSEQTFEPKFKVLKEQAEHHHKEEEEHLFPKVSKLLDAGARTTLAQEIMELQDRLHAEGKPRQAVMAETGAAAPLE
jgi:hemerythrin superfamily protein